MLFSGAAAREEKTLIKSFVNLLTGPRRHAVHHPKASGPLRPSLLSWRQTPANGLFSGSTWVFHL